jgi:hypothetical protein
MADAVFASLERSGADMADMLPFGAAIFGIELWENQSRGADECHSLEQTARQ